MEGRPLQELLQELGLNAPAGPYFEQALTHPTFANEQDDDCLDNQRLEFLGDAVLDLVVSHLLFERFAAAPEGRLTTLRARLVCTETLAELANQLKLGAYLKLGRGQEAGGRKNPSLLADAMEAVIGATYLSLGQAAAWELVQKLFTPYIDRLAEQPVLKDAKSRLQEWCQKRDFGPVDYQVLAVEGPDHARSYTVGVQVGDRLLGQGTGRSKKAAETRAARQALNELTGDPAVR